MILYPAIDLRQGHCIRLYQGDYERETVYSQDPLAMAKQFAEEGANWLHVVDLDGAKNPNQAQASLISELLAACSAKVQIGGGVRSKQRISTLLEQGASRVVIGSLAVENPEEVLAWFSYFGPDKMTLAFDVIMDENKQARVAVNAWQTTSAFLLEELIELYKKMGLRHLLCTNIALDGTLTGPDLGLYESLLTQFPFLELQASGGIQSLDDLRRLRKAGLAGAIVGRALYENKLTLKEALSC